MTTPPNTPATTDDKYAPDNVSRVIMLLYGKMDHGGPFWCYVAVKPSQFEAFKANLSKDVLFPKRLGYADELASMVVELIANSYMNAQTIRVDGGARLAPM